MGARGYYTHYQAPGFGLLQLGFRFYDPRTGRFTQTDPIGDGLNWYGYAGGNPMGWVDPWGLWTLQIGIVGTGGAGAGGTAGIGLVFGWSPQKGWQKGIYGTLGAGGYGGVAASLGISFALSRINDINRLAGPGGHVGAAGGEVVGGGLDWNANDSGMSYGGNAGLTIGTPAEVHGMVTDTWIIDPEQLGHDLGRKWSRAHKPCSCGGDGW